MGRALQPIAALALAGLVGACALASAPPANTYDVQAPTRFAGALGSSAAQLAITEPTVVGALDSERIVVRPSPTQITYLARSQWGARAPALVQARLIEAFQNSGQIRSVGRPGGAVANDVGLVTDLRGFHIDAARNAAVIEITARLVAESDGRVMASERFESTVPLASSDAGAMVAALNAAFVAVSGEIVAWTLARI